MRIRSAGSSRDDRASRPSGRVGRRRPVGRWRIATSIGVRAAAAVAIVHLALAVPFARGLLSPPGFAILAAALSVAGVIVATYPVARLLGKLRQFTARLGEDSGTAPMPPDGGRPALDVGLAQLAELVERRAAELEVARSVARGQAGTDHRLVAQMMNAQRIARLGSFEWERFGNRLHCSPEVFRLLGVAEGATPTASSVLAMIHPDDVRAFRRWVARIVRRDDANGLDLRVVRHSGDELHVHLLAEANRDGPRTVGLVGTIQDATERTRSIQQIHRLAYYDVLTELPNRSRFHEKLAETLDAARRGGRPFALLFVDLDQFKRINDTMGHGVGDELLRVVAQRLTRVLRVDDRARRRAGRDGELDVCRQGGDEFIVLLNNVASEHAARNAASRVIEALTQPIPIDGQEVFVTASIGIVLHPRDGTDLDTLLGNADVAMYHAKSAGRNRYAFYHDSMRQATAERLSLERDLRRAIEDEQFELHYQPQVDVRTNRIVGMEALIRWNHPTLGKLWPQHFIAVAEEAGIIMDIWEWVFVTSLIQHNVWRQDGVPPLRIGVNLSNAQFSDPALAARVREIADVVGVPLENVELELTESALAEDFDRAVETLRSLRAMGVRIAIDDFGTGYSSLSYLRRLPIDKLKLDHSFTTDAVESEQGAVVARSIIAIAEALRLEVVAEGVETQQQIDVLAQMGCAIMQGYLLARPLPVEAMTELLRRHFGIAAPAEAVANA